MATSLATCYALDSCHSLRGRRVSRLGGLALRLALALALPVGRQRLLERRVLLLPQPPVEVLRIAPMGDLALQLVTSTRPPLASSWAMQEA